MNIPLTPVRCLYRAVDLYPHKEAVVCGTRRFTYAEFGERCERLAAGLLSAGVQRGDRVAFLSFNTHRLFEGYFGPLLIRAVTLPLNVRLSAPELTAIVEHAAPRVMFYEDEFVPLLSAFRKTCQSIERYVSLDAAAGGYEELLSERRLERPDPFAFDENEMAELFYTSGSTGFPKGVMLSHRALYLHALTATSCMAQHDRVVELYTIPLFHANGWGRPQMGTLNAAKHVMVRRFEPVNVLRLIEEERATSMSLVPSMANALLNVPDLGRFDTSSLADIHLGGAPASPDLIARLEQAFRCHVMAGYGLTETGPMATSGRDKSSVSFRDENDRLSHRSMAGWPIFGTEVRVAVDDGSDAPRDMRTIGEVLIRGDNLMSGYYRDPEGTTAATRDGWLHTGDLAVWDSESFIHIVDRSKDIIISGGENISSVEVENAIAAHPNVMECAVVAAPDETWGEVPAAMIRLKLGSMLSCEELLAHLEERIARFKLPRIIRFTSDPLPKTGSGKVLKRELRETFWASKQIRVQG